MKGKTCLRLAPALLAACVMGAAFAKLPPPTPEAAAKAAEAKAKAAEAAKKRAEQLGKAQDRAVENYKREKGMGASSMASEAKPMKK